MSAFGPAAVQAGPGAPGGGVPGQADNPQAEEYLEVALKALAAFMGAEQDNQDKAVAATCIANLQKLLGGRQAGAESALGITPAHKAMARAQQGNQGPQGY